MAVGSAVPWNGSIGAGWDQLHQAEDSPWPFLMEATPAAPSPGAINLATYTKYSHLGKRHHHSQNLRALLTLHISIQGSADVGEANPSQSHTYAGGTKNCFSSLVNAALSSTINMSLFFL